MKQTILSLAFVVSILYSLAQEKQVIPEKTYVIPFQLTEHNNLSVQAVLNKKDTVHLMFHTAAGSLTLIEETVKKLSSLHFDGTDSVKSWGGGGNPSRFSKNNSLQIGELQWEDVSIWENKNSGPGTDGKFGLHLFEGKVIEIDFDKKIIILHTSLPRKAKKYEKLKLTFENDNMFLESGCITGKNTVNNKFLIHSGYAGSVLFDDKFAAENNMAQQLKITGEKELKDSHGNVLKTKKAILPALKIGNQKLTHVPVEFFQGAIGRQKMSLIGGDVLKRFNIIIDAQREWIYLTANHSKKTKYTTA
jgi:hypothetical protein